MSMGFFQELEKQWNSHILCARPGHPLGCMRAAASHCKLDEDRLSINHGDVSMVRMGREAIVGMQAGGHATQSHWALICCNLCHRLRQ
jgi:hypothetical protein